MRLGEGWSGNEAGEGWSGNEAREKNGLGMRLGRRTVWGRG